MAVTRKQIVDVLRALVECQFTTKALCEICLQRADCEKGKDVLADLERGEKIDD